MMKLTDMNSQQTDSLLLNCKIGSMEIYQFEGRLFNERVSGMTGSRSWGLFRISGSGSSGWGEYILPAGGKRIDLIHWSSVFMKLKGRSLPDALQQARTCREQWGRERCELAESALLDLARRLRHPEAQAPAVGMSPVMLERACLIEQAQSYFSF